MSQFAVARLDDIDEIDDGRCPFRPMRHHFGITSFGVNAMTGHSDGDRLINEHEEAEPDSSEELYVVMSGHVRFELDGELQEAPAGTFVRVCGRAPGRRT
jgi:mannose-6-phosphate isomerase-like protein (cupin superfamily)